MKRYTAEDIANEITNASYQYYDYEERDEFEEIRLWYCLHTDINGNLVKFPDDYGCSFSEVAFTIDYADLYATGMGITTGAVWRYLEDKETLDNPDFRRVCEMLADDINEWLEEEGL